MRATTTADASEDSARTVDGGERPGTDAGDADDGGAGAMRFVIPRGWIADEHREPNEALGAVDAETRRLCTPEPSPKLPEVPAELAGQLATWTPIVRNLLRCDNGGLRAPHAPDRRCDAWTQQLTDGGLPAAWATAVALTTQPRARRGDYRCGSEFSGAAAHRAAYVVAQPGDLRLLPFLLRYIAVVTPMYAQAMSGETVEFVWENVYRLALRSLGPATTSSFTDADTQLWRERLRRWGHWSLVFSTRDRAQWRDEALAAQRPRLHADERSSLIAAIILDQFESERARVSPVIARACQQDLGDSTERAPVWFSRMCWLRTNRFYDLPRDWRRRAPPDDPPRGR